MAAKKKVAQKKRVTKRGRDKKPRAPRNAWMPVFLEAFKTCGVVTHACQEAGVDRATITHRKDKDPKFAAKFDEVRAIVVGKLEEVAFMRATEGAKRETFKRVRGKWVKATLEVLVSDKLLIQLLRVYKPEVFDRETYLRCKIMEREAGLLDDGKEDPGVIVIPEADIVLEDANPVSPGVTDSAEAAAETKTAAEAQARYNEQGNQ